MNKRIIVHMAYKYCIFVKMQHRGKIPEKLTLQLFNRYFKL